MEISRKFRDKVPKRTYAKKYADYRRYKNPLKKDFHDRCGYCDIKDTWLGGRKVYHVDHFAPKAKFEYLKTEYSNLIYSCPYCNNAKSNTWPSNDPSISVLNDKGFVDPCNEEYDSLFYRDDEGRIIPRTELGVYIYEELHFYATRHSVIWKLEKIKSLKEQLILEKENIMNNENLKDKFIDLTIKYDAYFEYLGELINE